MKKKLEEKYNFVKDNTFQAILNKINSFGKSSLSLGQILLLILIIGSAFNYGIVYVFKLKYPIEITLEQLLAFGFSNLSWFLFLTFILYISTELVWQIKNIKEKNKTSKFILYTLLIVPVLLVYLFSFFIFYFCYEKQFIFLYVFLFTAMIILHIGILYKGNISNINYIRIITCIISVYIFILSNINILSLSGLGDYKATIMVDKNSFIKDMFDDFYDKNNKYHYKGDYIELKDVKILSTLGDIAYVELCSENIKIDKKLEENCEKLIRVEFIKKDIHIIRDGKKNSNIKDNNSKTNNESKEENKQDLEKSKENKKEENTNKNK